MSNLIESLESRNLLSASLSPAISADAAQAAIDSGTLRFQYQQYTPVLFADLKAMRTAVNAAPKMPGKATLLNRANAASLRDYNIIHADALAILATETAGVRLIVGDLAHLSARPTSAALKSKLNADVTRVGAKVSATVTKLGSQAAPLGTAASDAVTTLATAFAINTPVIGAVTTLVTDGSNFISTAGATIQSIQTDVSKFLSDAAAGN